MSGNKKRKPRKRFPFFDSSFFDKKLEFVVQGYGPSIIRISALISISSECIFSMELYVLSQSYIAHSVPELQLFSICYSIEDVGLPAGSAEVYAIAYTVVCNGEIPGARFLPVSCAVGEASVPSGIFQCTWSSGVLPVFTEYIELLNRNVQVYAEEFRFSSFEINFSFVTSCVNLAFFYYIVFILICNVIYAQFSEVEVISTTCKVEIRFVVIICIISEIAISAVELTIAGSERQLAVVVSNLSAIVSVMTIVQPACLIAEGNGLTAKTYGYIFAKVVIYIQLIHRCAGGIITFEIHFIQETALYVGGVINLAFNVDTDTAIPAILLVKALALITHTSIAGPVNVADLLFKVGYANAQVCEFVSIFASEFVQGCSLFSVQLIFLSEHAGNDLSHFITGDVSFALEGAIRIAFNDALFGQVYYCLVSPVGWGYIRERICSVCGYASGECCYSSECENFFHVLRSL